MRGLAWPVRELDVRDRFGLHAQTRRCETVDACNDSAYYCLLHSAERRYLR